mmetsp:Transcript_2005/g.3142  ORF Transcript_2005/g.3142 Transcript_2005/m.3142 type:complete len:255 (+) Transcript_2005:345-1109(+)
MAATPSVAHLARNLSCSFFCAPCSLMSFLRCVLATSSPPLVCVGTPSSSYAEYTPSDSPTLNISLGGTFAAASFSATFLAVSSFFFRTSSSFLALASASRAISLLSSSGLYSFHKAPPSRSSSLTPNSGRPLSRSSSHAAISSLASAPPLANALIWSRNFVMRSSTGAIASSALAPPPLPPSASPPISPKPTPPDVSATPRVARMVVINCAAELTRRGRMSAAAVFARYTLTAPTSSLSDLTTPGVLMLSSIAA